MAAFLTKTHTFKLLGTLVMAAFLTKKTLLRCIGALVVAVFFFFTKKHIFKVYLGAFVDATL